MSEELLSQMNKEATVLVSQWLAEKKEKGDKITEVDYITQKAYDNFKKLGSGYSSFIVENVVVLIGLAKKYLEENNLPEFHKTFLDKIKYFNRRTLLEDIYTVLEEYENKKITKQAAASLLQTLCLSYGEHCMELIEKGK